MSADVEERLRRHFEARAAAVQPATDAWERIQGATAGSAPAAVVQPLRKRNMALALVGVLVGALATGRLLTTTDDDTVVAAGSPQAGRRVAFDDGLRLDLRALGDHGRLAVVSAGRLYTVDLATSEARQITFAGDAAHLRWSADGGWIAFEVRETKHSEDYGHFVATADGTRSMRIEGPGAWSPTGHRLLVASEDGGLSLLDPDRDQETQLIHDGWFADVHWSPTGQGAAVVVVDSVNGQLSHSIGVVDDLADPALRLLPPGEVRTGASSSGSDGSSSALTFTEFPARPILLGWSPDASKLLALVQSDGRYHYRLISVADGRQVELATAGTGLRSGGDDLHAWTTDGTSLAIVTEWARGGTPGELSAPGEIVVCDVGVVPSCAPLTGAATAGGLAASPAFSDDGDALAFLTEQPGGSGRELEVVRRLDGTWRRALAVSLSSGPMQGGEQGPMRFMAEGERTLAWTPDGLLVRSADGLHLVRHDGMLVLVAEPLGYEPGRPHLPGSDVFAWWHAGS